jgi:ABC-2 type transport system ATP-binding protein
MPAVEARNLSKTYTVSQRGEGLMGSVKGLFRRETRTVDAVKSVSFQVEPGELVAFLGPNGAGKTTTLKMLSGLLYPTSGELRVLGNVPFEKKPDFLRRFSFVMGQKHQLWWELPALDTFRLNAAVFDIDEKRFRRRLDELNTLLQLDPLWHTPVKKLSLGQRMKMELACSLLHEPELLLLDEPTIGLDVVMQKTLRDFVARLNREGKTTILLTSHNMGDIETLCRRVVVIHHGTILFDGDLPDLVARFVPAKQVTAVLKEERSEGEMARFGTVQELNTTRVVWEIPRGEVSRRVAEVLNNLPVVDLSVDEMPLEDVIRRVFREGAV